MTKKIMIKKNTKSEVRKKPRRLRGGRREREARQKILAASPQENCPRRCSPLKLNQKRGEKKPYLEHCNQSGANAQWKKGIRQSMLSGVGIMKSIKQVGASIRGYREEGPQTKLKRKRGNPRRRWGHRHFHY